MRSEHQAICACPSLISNCRGWLRSSWSPLSFHNRSSSFSSSDCVRAATFCETLCALKSWVLTVGELWPQPGENVVAVPIMRAHNLACRSVNIGLLDLAGICILESLRSCNCTLHSLVLERFSPASRADGPQRPSERIRPGREDGWAVQAWVSLHTEFSKFSNCPWDWSESDQAICCFGVTDKWGSDRGSRL